MAQNHNQNETNEFRLTSATAPQFEHLLAFVDISCPQTLHFLKSLNIFLPYLSISEYLSFSIIEIASNLPKMLSASLSESDFLYRTR